MRLLPARTVIAALMLAAAGCPGGGAAFGDSCGDSGDCSSSLQCLRDVCVPRCQRGPDCGDGYRCDKSGICQTATGRPGDPCVSETTCGSGLSCQLDGTATGGDGLLLAACTAQNAGRPSGSSCAVDANCRNGTCALGRCVDLCADTRDCAIGSSCQQLPRVDNARPDPLGTFTGCLPAQGSISWTIPIASPRRDLLLPVPGGATGVSVLFSVDDRSQLVGATRLVAPDGTLDYQPCSPPGLCDLYFTNPVRHAPGLGESVLEIPTSPSPDGALQAGVYHLQVSSLRADGVTGSAIPKVTVVAKLDASVILDLHFHFLDLTDHPCAGDLGAGQLNAANAQTAAFFRNDFIGQLKGILAHAGVALGSLSYDDILDHPDLDGLDVADAPSLLSLGTYADGINVFFVRTLSPIGLQAFGPNPGPGGLAGTTQSGIAIGLDTRCYRTWPQIARLTVHEIARYMGLSHNVEAELAQHPAWRDQIEDSDDSNGNLMFYSELGGLDLSVGQRDILSKSAALR